MIWKGTHLSIKGPRIDTGLCWGTNLGKGTKQFLQHWRSPRTQWPPSFLNGRSLEPPRLFLELAAWPNWAIGVEGPWSGRWPRTRWSLWQSSRVPLWRWENLPEGQPFLQPSTNQDFMIEWPDGSHSSVKVNKILWSDETKIELLAWIPSVMSGGNLGPSLRWSMVLTAWCGDVFIWKGLGD